MSNPRILPAIVKQATRAAGLELPAAILKADETHARALAVLDTPGSDDFMPHALDALRRGVHPVEDEACVARFLHAYLASVNFDTRARGALDEERGAAYLAAFDDCLDLWRPTFDEAAQSIADAAEVLGKLFTTDAAADHVLRSGPAAAAAWLEATQAAVKLDHIVDAVAALAYEANRGALRDPAAIIVEHDVDKWLTNKPTRADKVLTLARRGHRLELHTLAEAQAFMAQVALEEDRRSAKAAADMKPRTVSYL